MKQILILLTFLSTICLNAQIQPFEPDGYYFPAKKLVIAGHVISNIDIRTLDYSFDDTTHVLQSKTVEPEILVSVTGVRRRAKGYNLTLSPDSLSFYFFISPLDKVEFSGEFTDKRGKFYDCADITALKTVVMKGTFRLIKKGKIASIWNRDFTFWQGD